MHSSVDRILTTHVGSLPRSQAVTDVLFAREQGTVADAAAAARTIRDGVAEVVRRQVETGIDLVSDGEMSKISYATYIKDRVTGFDGDTQREPGQDLVEFPRLLRKLADTGATAKYRRPRCVGEIRVKSLDPVQADIANLQAAVAAARPTAAFMNAASPGVIALFQPNDHYPTQDAYLEAVAGAMRAEYEAIVASGILLQIDAPDLAMGRHTMYRNRSIEEFLGLAAQHIEVLNAALRNIPAERVRMHVCWGNYEGPHHHDVPMELLWPVIARARVAGPAVRGRQSASRARMGRVQGAEGPRRQGAHPRSDRIDVELRGAPAAGRRADLPVRRSRRPRARDRGQRLWFQHLRGIRAGRSGHRVPEVALARRRRRGREPPPVAELRRGVVRIGLSS